jgi:hypothetical protein
LAAAAGAGAAAGIYYSDRGAESTVDAPFDEVVAASERALAEMGVPINKGESESDQKDATRETTLEGSRNDGEGDVEVTVKQEEGVVKVVVVAKKTEVTWDKDFAGKVLEKIVQYAK